MEIFGIPTQALFGQLLIGLINGSFYALLSLGLAVIFGLLNIINFTHGAQYMMGAFCAYFLLTKLGIGYWWGVAGPPPPGGIIGVGVERVVFAGGFKLYHPYTLFLSLCLAPLLTGACSSATRTPRLPSPL